MQKIKIKSRNGETISVSASALLLDINDSASISELMAHNWSGNGKADLLKGGNNLFCEVVEPLTNEQVEKALSEYKELLCK